MIGENLIGDLARIVLDAGADWFDTPDRTGLIAAAVSAPGTNARSRQTMPDAPGAAEHPQHFVTIRGA